MNVGGQLNRRAFLAASVVAMGSTAFPLAAKSKDPARWQLGCYTRPWDQHDYRVALDAIAEAGFTYVGIMTGKGKSWVLITPETPPEDAAQIGAEVKQRGLKTISVYGDFKLAESIEASIQNLHRLIDHCVACGSPDLLLGGTTEIADYEPYYKAVAESCAYARERRVRLTIKPHGGQNATGTACRKAIKRVGKKNFRLWYDPGNIFYYSDGALNPVDDAATVDGLVVGMSVKDFKAPKEVLLTPGTGQVNFLGVLARLQKGGFREGPLVVECLDPGDVPAVTAEARKARLFLEELLRQLDSPDAAKAAKAGDASRPF